MGVLGTQPRSLCFPWRAVYTCSLPFIMEQTTQEPVFLCWRFRVLALLPETWKAHVRVYATQPSL